MSRSNSAYRPGITIIELLIAIVIISSTLVGMILMLTRAMSDARFAATRTELDSKLSLALTRLEDDVQLATQFEGDIAGPYADTYAPVGGWDYSGDSATERVLILSMPATVDRSGTPGRILTYQNDASFNCTTELTYNPVHTYRTVYFVDNQTLYKRFVTDTTTSLCNAQVQKQTCPADQIGSWPAECEARDEVIATNITEFSIDYVLGGESEAIPSQYTDPQLIRDSKAAIVTLRMGSSSPSAPESIATLRLTRVN